MSRWWPQSSIAAVRSGGCGSCRSRSCGRGGRVELANPSIRRPAGHALVAVVGLVGFTEELVPRRRPRDRPADGATEGKVALVELGDLRRHAPEPRARHGHERDLQALAVSFTGDTRPSDGRWAGRASRLCAMPVHASQDFVILSGQVGVDPETSPLTFVVLPVMIGLGDPAVAAQAPHRARRDACGVSAAPRRPGTGVPGGCGATRRPATGGRCRSRRRCRCAPCARPR